MGRSELEGIVAESVHVGRPIRRTWAAIADPDELRAWWPHLTLEVAPGGRFTERWTAADGSPRTTRGRVVELDEGRLLRLSWADDGWPAATEVELRLEATPAGTLVHVRHAGWDALPDGARLAHAHRTGWRSHLENLRRHAEG